MLAITMVTGKRTMMMITSVMRINMQQYSRAEIFGGGNEGPKFTEKWLKRTKKVQICKNLGNALCSPHSKLDP